MCSWALSWRNVPFLWTNASCRHCSFQCISSILWAYFSDLMILLGFRTLQYNFNPNTDFPKSNFLLEAQILLFVTMNIVFLEVIGSLCLFLRKFLPSVQAWRIVDHVSLLSGESRMTEAGSSPHSSHSHRRVFPWDIHHASVYRRSALCVLLSLHGIVQNTTWIWVKHLMQ